MKVYGIGRPEEYVDATVYACGDGEEILWSFHETPDALLSDEEVTSQNLPRSLAIRCNVTRTSFLISQTDDKSVVYDIIHDMMQDMYPDWVPTIGDNVSIYANVQEKSEGARFDPRNEPEDAGLYDVMEYEK